MLGADIADEAHALAVVLAPDVARRVREGADPDAAEGEGVDAEAHVVEVGRRVAGVHVAPDADLGGRGVERARDAAEAYTSADSVTERPCQALTGPHVAMSTACSMRQFVPMRETAAT